jgi:hypothetical protein
MNNKIKSIEALQLEKERLKKLCKEKEDVIGKKLNYIQDNIGLIALESILPVNIHQKDSINHIFDGLHSIFQLLVPGLAEKFSKSEKWIKIIEMIALSLFSKFYNKKTE